MGARSRIGRLRPIVVFLAGGLALFPGSTDAGASWVDHGSTECLSGTSSAIVDWGDHVSGRLMRSTQRGVRVDVELRSDPSGVALCDREAHVQIWWIGDDRQLLEEGLVEVVYLANGDPVHRYDWIADGSGGRPEPGVYEIVFVAGRIDVIGVDISDASRATYTRRGSSLAVRVSSPPVKERVRDIAPNRRPDVPVPDVPVPDVPIPDGPIPDVDVVIIGRS